MIFAADTTCIEYTVTYSPAHPPLMSARAKMRYRSRGSKATPAASMAALPARLMATIPAAPMWLNEYRSRNAKPITNASEPSLANQLRPSMASQSSWLEGVGAATAGTGVAGLGGSARCRRRNPITA